MNGGGSQPSGLSSEARPVNCLGTTRGRGLTGLQTLNNVRVSGGSSSCPSGLGRPVGIGVQAHLPPLPRSCATTGGASASGAPLHNGDVQFIVVHTGISIFMLSNRVQGRKVICPRSHSLDMKKSGQECGLLSALDDPLPLHQMRR